jgi:muramoyltetrapeptide carboxypeptidase
MSEIAAPLRSLAMPSPLGAGARVALIAPAGPLAGPSDVANAEANARALGWEPVVARHALGRYGYFAGTDAERLRDLQAALDDPAIDGVWCLRGGYGTMRLLPALDLEALRARPRALIGFSDITALHAAWQAAGLVSFHGPVARNPLGPFSAQSMRRAVIDGSDSAGHAAEAVCVREGVAEGRLLGGNLALVAALVGTRWALSFRDAIVVLEDVNEATYRMDRMLVQLRLAGAFDGCRGLVFGQCTDCPDSSEDGRRSLHDLVAELAADLGVPALLGVPVGHIAEQWTLPFGAVATLDATAQYLHLHRSTP